MPPSGAEECVLKFMPKPAFSPTQFSIYLRCPLKYKLAYVDKLARRFGRARASLTLGGAAHRALQTFCENGGPNAFSPDVLLALFEANWRNVGFASPEEEQRHYEAGRLMLLDFYEAEKARPSMTIFVEKTVKQDRGEYVLTGKIDRLDRLPDGSLEIIDYKSGREELDEADVANEVGLMAYEVLIRSRYPDAPIRVAIVALRINRRVSVLRSPEESAEVADYLDELAHLMIADEVYPGRILESCSHCDFRRICPAFRRENYPLLTT
jgi:RecB family exonuclease